MQIGADDILIALGYRPGIRLIDSVFTNTDIGTGTVPETISQVGGMLQIRTTAAVVEIVSDSALDTSSGTGAREVLVSGLDVDYNMISETIIPNGLTAVQGSLLFYRINDVRCTSAGSTKSNAGNILVRDAGAGTTRAKIAAARGRSEDGVFTVPAGYTLLATGWTVASRDASGDSSADVEFFATTNGVRRVDWSLTVTGTVPANLGSTHVFYEKTDIEVVVSRVLSNGTRVSFHGHGVLVGPGNGL